MKSIFSLFFIAAMTAGFVSCGQNTSKNNMAQDIKTHHSKESKAYFAAGCFWHEEALFQTIKGVNDVISGYAGGTTKNPDYGIVETGNSGHAESVVVCYDPSKISYETLLKVYFAAQDPTQANGQAPDFGSQYRSIAFYTNNTEKEQIENYIKQLNASGKYKAPIAVNVMPLIKFWVAETYHQDYIKKNPNSMYVDHVSIPEIKNFQKEYPQLVKKGDFF